MTLHVLSKRMLGPGADAGAVAGGVQDGGVELADGEAPEGLVQRQQRFCPHVLKCVVEQAADARVGGGEPLLHELENVVVTKGPRAPVPGRQHAGSGEPEAGFVEVPQDEALPELDAGAPLQRIHRHDGGGAGRSLGQHPLVPERALEPRVDGVLERAGDGHYLLVVHVRAQRHGDNELRLDGEEDFLLVDVVLQAPPAHELVRKVHVYVSFRVLDAGSVQESHRAERRSAARPLPRGGTPREAAAGIGDRAVGHAVPREREEVGEKAEGGGNGFQEEELRGPESPLLLAHAPGLRGDGAEEGVGQQRGHLTAGQRDTPVAPPQQQRQGGGSEEHRHLERHRAHERNGGAKELPKVECRPLRRSRDPREEAARLLRSLRRKSRQHSVQALAIAHRLA
mmetsp:Transcript_22609/g.63485  ORF Transcript_22609/g.63485 Transcript_22609/m.63485 type:complete len:397 (+) Transcript_22609:74-1264(+)